MQTFHSESRNGESLSAMAANAQFVLRETERFMAKFPPRAANEPSMPAFTWNQLERQLLDLAEDKTMAPFLRSALTHCARQAEHLPPELLLREILVLAAMAQEERPTLDSQGSTPGTGEGSCMA